MVIFYKKWKKYNETQLTKNKMDLNIRKMTNHPPSPDHLCLTLFFQTALPCSGSYHMERGGMQLHDAVGINCKMGATTENQDSAVKYTG